MHQEVGKKFRMNRELQTTQPVECKISHVVILPNSHLNNKKCKVYGLSVPNCSPYFYIFVTCSTIISHFDPETHFEFHTLLRLLAF